jgi:hypothetical protein
MRFISLFPIGIILTQDYNIIISSAQNKVIDWFFSIAIKHLSPSEKEMIVMKIFEKKRFLLYSVFE